MIDYHFPHNNSKTFKAIKPNNTINGRLSSLS